MSRRTLSPEVSVPTCVQFAVTYGTPERLKKHMAGHARYAGRRGWKSLYCDHCDIVVASNDDMMLHLVSPEHERNTSFLPFEDRIGDLVEVFEQDEGIYLSEPEEDFAYCQLCDVSFFKHQLQEHIFGKSHQMKSESERNSERFDEEECGSNVYTSSDEKSDVLDDLVANGLPIRRRRKSKPGTPLKKQATPSKKALEIDRDDVNVNVAPLFKDHVKFKAYDFIYKEHPSSVDILDASFSVFPERPELPDLPQDYFQYEFYVSIKKRPLKKDVEINDIFDYGYGLKFKFNQRLIDIVKGYVRGRKWNDELRLWTFDAIALPSVVKLLQFLAIKFNEYDVMDDIKLIESKLGTHAHRTFTLKLFDDDRPFAQLYFAYDVFAVAMIKQLSPIERSFDKDRGCWRIQFHAISKLIHLLSVYGYEVPQGLTQFKAGEEPLSLLPKNIDNEEMHHTSSSATAKMGFEHSESPEVDPPFMFPKLLPDLEQEEQDQPSQVSVLSQDASSSQGFSSSSSQDSVIILSLSPPRMPRRPSTIRPQQQHVGYCDDCGKRKDHGQRHICRFFGFFRCDCGHSWTSGYTWQGEKQACRSCEKDMLPWKTQKLQPRTFDDYEPRGPHDAQRCGMCRRLGRLCTE
jgi:hypothetical protein